MFAVWAEARPVLLLPLLSAALAALVEVVGVGEVAGEAVGRGALGGLDLAILARNGGGGGGCGGGVGEGPACA